jgi:hypothetical protein
MKQVRSIRTDKPDQALSKPYKPFTEFKGDTLQYLQYNFIERKDQYEGKKLEVLLKDLEFNIKFSFPGYLGNDASKSDDVSIAFYDIDTYSTKRENNEKLCVMSFKWKEPIMATDVDKLRAEYGREWTTHHQKLYGKQVISDVYVVVLPDPNRPK